MRAIVTVVGKDRVGIIAGICGVLAELNVNVLDISQTILQEVFVMNMLVDIEKANCEFSVIVEALDREGERLGMSIRIQLEEIFDAMHKI